MGKLLAIAIVSVVLVAVILFVRHHQQVPPVRPKGEELNKEMEALADKAVADAKKQFGVDLDYSDASVKKVEEILSTIYSRHPSDQDSRTYAVRFGAYLGEVMRAQTGGDWITVTNEQHDPGLSGEHFVLQHRNGSISFPIEKCFKRLVNGEEDNVWFFYRVLVDKNRTEKK